jgi:hypothetical protein
MGVAVTPKKRYIESMSQLLSFFKFGFLALTFLWAWSWAGDYSQKKITEIEGKIVPPETLNEVVKVRGAGWIKINQTNQTMLKLWRFAHMATPIYAIALFIMLLSLFGQKW